MIYFIVNKKEHTFKRDKRSSVSKQVAKIAKTFEKSNPGLTNIFKSKVRKNCWHLFGDYLTTRDISDVTGHTRHKIRNRTLGKQTCEILKATRGENGSILIAFDVFAKYDFDIRIPEEKKAECHPLILEGKEESIKSYFFDDNLSLSVIAKALGVTHNTMFSFCEKRIPGIATQITLKRHKKEIQSLFNTDQSLKEIAAALKVSLRDLRVCINREIPDIAEIISLENKTDKIADLTSKDISMAGIAKALGVSKKSLKLFLERNMPEYLK